jgi:hypothetical protein
MVDLTPRGLIQQIVQSAASSDSTMPLLIEFAQKILSLLEQKCGAMTSDDKF